MSDLLLAISGWRLPGATSWLSTPAAVFDAPPGRSVSAPEIDGDVAAVLANAPSATVLVFYSAPWECGEWSGDSTFDVPGAMLDSWLEYHRKLLRSWRKHKRNLVLVNAGRLRDALPALLEVVESRTGLVLQWSESMMERLDTSGRDPLAAVRGQLFEWLAPEFWDVYESLESCAWIEGREPEFRSTTAAPDAGALAALVGEWSLARQAPRLAARVEALEAEKAQVASEESELLLLQLHQVQEELEQNFLQLQSEKAAAAEARSDLDTERAQKSSHANTLDAELKRLQSRIKELENTSRENEKESELLLLQLHQVQEELENYFLENQRLYGLLEKSTATFKRARQAVKGLTSAATN